MSKPKLIRITTVPLSLEKLLEGQLSFMSEYFEVTAISSEAHRLEAYAVKEGVHSFSVGLTRKITPFQDLKAVLKLYRYFRKTKPYIVHTHTPKAGFVGMLAAWLARVPNRIHTVAGLPLMESQGLKKSLLVFIEKYTYRFATKIIPNSKGLMTYMLDRNLTKKGKISFVRNGSSNGIDTGYFDRSNISEIEIQSIQDKLGVSKDNFLFLFVGRLVKDKGIVELIDAFFRFHKQFPGSSLVLVGPFEHDLDPIPQPTLDVLSNHPNIHVTGYQEDVRPYFAMADVFVFPSYREGFPNVVLQAGAMEIPCIVSNINGCNEIIKEGQNGLIVPLKDAKPLFEAMTYIYENPQVREKMAKRSRDLITEHFERKEFWEELLAFYNSL